MTYKILSSGSKGNAVILNDYILVDCGVPFKVLQPYYKDLKVVFLTHIHMDHFNLATINRLARERPTLRFACGEWLINDLIGCRVDKRNIDVLVMDCVNDYRAFSVEPFKTKHNIPNCGFKFDLKSEGMQQVFYATDLNTLEGIEANGYDIYMIEANYKEEEIANRIAEKKLNGEYAYEREVLKNHLSEEKALNWLYENMGSHSQYIFVHKHDDK
ncbi:MAG TPA: hypothetical protein DIC60_01180 [Lachnospiraceae bacterium]|nr:hypothetical protein [Lachnospiraceae bacterium]